MRRPHDSPGRRVHRGDGSGARCPVVLAAIAVVLGASCAVRRPRAYSANLAAGDRALSAGRAREAAGWYDHAAEATRRPLDRDEAVYRAAQALRRAGEHRAALTRFEWLAANGELSSRQARAALEAIRLRLSMGERAAAETAALALIRRAPRSGPARRAVTLVVLARDEVDPTGVQALRWIEQAIAIAGGAEIESALWAERAARLERLGRPEDAAAAYRRLLSLSYPSNPHWDDGAMAYARLLLRLGRPVEAVAVIDRALAARERASAVGSYERPRYAQLGMLRAAILRDQLRRPEAAADAFHAVYAGYPTSLLRDDALYAEAVIRAGIGQRTSACELYARILREFPCGHAARRARLELRACGGSEPAATDAGCGSRASAGR